MTYSPHLTAFEVGGFLFYTGSSLPWYQLLTPFFLIAYTSPALFFLSAARITQPTADPITIAAR